MILALAAWGASFTCLLASGVFFARQQRIAGFALVVLLLVQVHVRPVLYFLGLDSPAPYEFFPEDSWPLVATGLLFSVLFLTCATMTYAACSRNALGALMPQAPDRYSLDTVVRCAALLTLLNVAATGYMVLQSGSIGDFMVDVKFRKELKGLYAIREIGKLGAIVAALGLLAAESAFRRKVEPRRRYRRIVWWMLVLITVNFGVNYTWGNRYSIALLILAFGSGWHFYIRRFRPWELVLASIAVLAMLESLKQLRWLLFETVLETGEVGNEFSFWRSISASMHFNQFDAFLLAIRDTGDVFEFREGKDFINGLLSWIPRFIYPEKESYHIGGWFRRLYEPDTVNGWPITMIGAWYINFGVPGVVLGGMSSGFVAAVIDRAYRPLSRSAWAAVAGPTAAFKLLAVNFGIFQEIILFLIPLYALAFLLRVSRPRTAPGPAMRAPDSGPRARTGPLTGRAVSGRAA